jgi:hypothetical protein
MSKNSREGFLGDGEGITEPFGKAEVIRDFYRAPRPSISLTSSSASRNVELSRSSFM